MTISYIFFPSHWGYPPHKGLIAIVVCATLIWKKSPHQSHVPACWRQRWTWLLCIICSLPEQQEIEFSLVRGKMKGLEKGGEWKWPLRLPQPSEKSGRVNILQLRCSKSFICLYISRHRPQISGRFGLDSARSSRKTAQKQRKTTI